MSYLKNSNDENGCHHRDPFWDAVKGVGYLCVLIGHMDLSKYIFNFHMPLFFVVSGMFFSEKTTLKRLVRNIVMPWFYFAVICSGLTVVLTRHLDVLLWVKTAVLGRPYVCNSLWFLTALFMAQLFCMAHLWLVRKIGKEWLLLAVELPFFAMLGWCASWVRELQVGRYVPLMMLSVPMAYFFFLLGNGIRISIPDLQAKLRGGFILIPLLVLYGVVTHHWGFSNMFNPVFDSLPVFIVTALLGTVCVVLAVGILRKTKALEVFAWIGRYSIAFFLIEEYSIRISVKIMKSFGFVVNAPVYSMPTTQDNIHLKAIVALTALCISVIVVPWLMKGLDRCKELVPLNCNFIGKGEK